MLYLPGYVSNMLGQHSLPQALYHKLPAPHHTARCAGQEWYPQQSGRLPIWSWEFSQVRLYGIKCQSGSRFNIKMSSYQYRKSHCWGKTVVISSYLHNGISYTGKTTNLYWIRAQYLWIGSYCLSFGYTFVIDYKKGCLCRWIDH